VVRVLSALVLLPIVVGVIVGLPPIATVVLASLLVALAFREYGRLARQLDLPVIEPLGTALALALSVALALAPGALASIVLVGLILGGAQSVASRRIDREAVSRLGVTLFGALYVGLPLGALAAVRGRWGAEALLLLLLTLVASDTSQYYVGRAIGRRRLAPRISPGKTVEGAIGGLAAGAVTMAVAGNWWLPGVAPGVLALGGAVIAALGIVGDLFESRLKRSAGVKDASSMIPGHGGVLDRLDGFLLAGPMYYLVLEWQ